MRAFLLLLPLLLSGTGSGKPVVASRQWEEACDGSTFEVVSEHSKILSVQARAVHSEQIREWTIHYVNDVAVTAEYRVTARGRFAAGDHAGEPSGVDRLVEIRTWQREKDCFAVDEDDLRKELDGILSQARSIATAN